MLSTANRRQIILAYLAQQAQAIKDKEQLREIDDCPTLHGQQLILMKGATRLFDKLYPTQFHRQMSDIDIYIGQQDCISSFAGLGYEVMDKSQGKIEDIDTNFVQLNSLTNHHLPPIVSKRFSKRLELHSFFIQRFIQIEMRPSVVDDANKLANTNCVQILSPLDQLILLIIHSRFADRSAYFGSSRLRGLLEGMLLHRQLSTAEQNQFNDHFHYVGAGNEIQLWKYTCYRLFNAIEFAELDSTSMRLRYKLHELTSQSGWTRSIAYAFRSMHLLVTHRLRSPLERKQFFLRLFDSNRWRRYFRRITRIR